MRASSALTSGVLPMLFQNLPWLIDDKAFAVDCSVRYPCPAAGDTTEEEEFLQEENDCPRPRGWGTTLGSIEEDARPDRDRGPNFGKERETPGQIDASENCNMIALQCITELVTRTNSMQNSLGNQTTCNETIRSDLEEIRSRLAAVETAIEVTNKAGENTAAEESYVKAFR
ncbi:hypothetical protein N7523_002089 [Penicillium sp. IBT 18751x]|nr:hypothetical protein N7523_001956 [Penicillium sp. IBT 18751x]KAJ6126477.1 hypothetical protein N7523_002089 [Penicillium sp. IBT 18751x]